LKYPVPLIEAVDESQYGGKSVSLSRALRAGLPVPPGVALSVAAVERVVAAAAGGALDAKQGEGGGEALPQAAEILSSLGDCVAVRSSAVGEDDQANSFAGQHATLLNVRTPEDLIEAILEVYRSAHTASALAYRERMGISGQPRMGIAVQELVDADAAGVLFTHNPATGAEERLIEGAWGLGEAVVSGIIIPDSYRISPEGAVLERTPGQKDVALRPDAGGGIEEIPVEPSRSRALCLDDDQLGALHALTLACEAEYGARLDIEWAFSGDRVYLLQCRAITR
jgi:pyruvate,water dikinase